MAENRSAMTKGAAKKVKSGMARRKSKYPRQAARTEKNEATQAKARVRWLKTRRAKPIECRGQSAFINAQLRIKAAYEGVSITTYKKNHPNWRSEVLA